MNGVGGGKEIDTMGSSEAVVIAMYSVTDGPYRKGCEKRKRAQNLVKATKKQKGGKGSINNTREHTPKKRVSEAERNHIRYASASILKEREKERRSWGN